MRDSHASPLLSSVVSRLHQVPTGHAGVLVGEDVAVVEPPPRVVLHEVRADRLVRPQRRAVDERPAGVAPAVAVDVEGVEVRVHPDHVDRDALADPRADGRRVAREGAAVDAVQTGAGCRSPAAGSCAGTAPPRRPARARRARGSRCRRRGRGSVLSVWLGPWSWYGQAPTESGVASQTYVNSSPGADEAAGAREVAEVGAVVLGVVADPVRVDRDRLVEPRSALRKCTTSVSPTSASSVGPGMRAGPDRLGEAGAELLVDEGAQHALARQRLLHPLVAPGRGDVPARSCAPAASTRAARRRAGARASGTGRSRPAP